MTEQASLREQNRRSSVEEIHASIPHKGARDLLNDAKNIQRHINRELEDIETDEDLNPEAKQRRAQEVIDRHSPKIAKAYQDVREKVEAARLGNREGYLEALRSYMKTGRDEALRIRRGAA